MIQKSDPDIDLVKKFQESGDENVFNTLYYRYINKVYNFCLAFVGDEDDAKDCAQETFIRVFRSIGMFRAGSKFSTWIYSIMSNVCRDMMRKQSYKERRVSAGNEGGRTQGGSLVDPQSHYPDPHTEMTNKEMYCQFLSALQKLKPSNRRVIILRDLEGRSYEEISQITGKNLGTVRSTLARGRHQMANYLNMYRNEL
jgi:RNA polymerase sigma-70 factor (ECF subfamily)